MKGRVLVVDDSKAVRIALEKIIVEQGFLVDTAADGKEALELLKKSSYSILLTDYEMPVMNGRELLGALSGLEIPPVTMVLTSHSEIEIIVEIMKLGAFDYLVKPVSESDLAIRLDRAYKHSKLSRMQMIAEKERYTRMEQQIEWYHFHEKLMNGSKKIENNSLFENIHRSLSQGGGIGTMLTLLDLITMSAKKKGDKYEVDGALFEQIRTNLDQGYRAISIFNEIEGVSQNNFKLEDVSIDEVYKSVVELKDELKRFAEIRKHKIMMSEPKKGFESTFIKIDRTFFLNSIRELILNALKYAKNGSTVMVLMEFVDKNFKFSVYNIPRPENKEGIPMEYENIVFEPFFRIDKYIQSEYETLDYGLGLSYVERVIKKHKGSVRIFNVTDYSNLAETSTQKVCCTITVPLV